MADATDLKSVLAKSEVWVRIPSSALSKMRFYEGKSLKFAIQRVTNGRERKRTEITIYLPSIRQVTEVSFLPILSSALEPFSVS